MGEVVTSKFTIDSKDAELAVQRVDKVVALCNMTVSELKKNLGEMFVDQKGKIGESNKKIAEGTEGLKGYRQEQRMQNYLFREGSQSILSLVLAYSFLQQGQEKASGTGKKVADALVTGFMAANATEFAFFTLGQAGEKMGGKVGGAMAKIGKYGGEIGLVVGVIIAARQAFEELMQTTDRFAQRDLRFFGERTPRLSLETLLGDRDKVDKEIKSIVDSSPLKSMGKALLTGNLGEFVMAYENEKKLYDLRARQKIINEAIDERSKINLGTIEAINIQIADAVAKRDVEAKTVEEIAAWNEKIVKLEQEKGLLLKTNEERRKAEIGLAFALRDAKNANVANEYDRQRYDAALEYDKKVFQIESDRKKAIIDGVSRRAAAETAHKQVQEANLTLGQKILKIQYDQEHDLALLKAENLTTEQAKIEARYKVEEKYIQKQLELGVYGKEEAEGRFYQLRRKREEDLAQLQIQTLGELAQGFQAIEQGLNSIGVKADTTLSRMIQMAQVALRIAQLISKIDSTPGGGSTGDYLGIIGNVLGFLGLFDSGGWTGPGSRGQVAGLVHRDEIVFEQPLVQRYRNELLSLRKSMQMGMPMSAAFPASDNGGLGTAILVSEIRSLKEAIRSMPIQPIFKNILDTQKIVREEMPGYEQYKTSKQVDNV